MHLSSRTTPLATFDPSKGEHPENVVMTLDGTLYVTLHQGASVQRLETEGRPTQRAADLACA
ncbi:hypothetical protein E7T06_19730 [Deinococcus sp. Arct2-2]|uniref:hypothetical protein n=1 Tax=Deinococcus sp. Arct2-2 TaxID=2568653 RepID=UPI0010A2D675|nr:hypothetical protein [Deinococcus sp. Arct2-2]THF67731.1 hypothetical protein E7T06_19730 [Deinococcus sp. Arct2-2]